MKSISNSKYIQQNLLSALSFSNNGKYAALGLKNNNKLVIFKINNLIQIDSWQIIQQFRDQTQPISQIDWSNDQKIVSGSHDRSVFVYKKNGQKWQKMLVNIDIKLSILCIKWAPNGRKFAYGGSCNSLGLSFYNIQSSCWTAVSNDKISKSPIISISFHPSSNLIAIGSTDNSIKIVTCSFRKTNDKFVQNSNVQTNDYQGPFSNIDGRFQVLFSVQQLGGWINHLSWQVNGNFLLVLPHGNIIKLYQIIDQNGKIDSKQTNIKWNGLPFLNGFIDQKGLLYCGGYDKKVAVFSRSNTGYNFVNYLQNNQKTSKQRVSGGRVSSMISGMQRRSIGVNNDDKKQKHDKHVSAIKLFKTVLGVGSFDINGGIHFWN